MENNKSYIFHKFENLNINFFDKDIKKENDKLKVEKSALFDKLENKEKEIYDLKMVIRNNKINVDRFISILNSKINTKLKNIDSLKKESNIHSQKIYNNEINLEDFVVEFTRLNDYIEKTNEIVISMENKYFTLQQLLEKYSTIEYDFSVLKNDYQKINTKYQEIIIKYNSFRDNSNLDIKLLKYQISKLQNSNKKIQSESDDIKDNYLCVICQSNKKDIVLLPCKHYILCNECEENNYNITRERKCPICRNEYFDKMLLYT